MGEMRGRVVIGVVVAVVAVSVGGLLGRVGEVSVAPTTLAGTSAGSTRPGTISVHVAGMVLSPGVVTVASDAIVADAIEAAGGLRPGALVERINLAAPVSDGEQILVPGPEDTHDGGASETGAGGPLSLNRASAKELETLPGVGPVLAERIVAFREASGGFEVVEDLLEVPGIGEAKLAAMRDLVTP